jgi:hypothetical protein
MLRLAKVRFSRSAAQAFMLGPAPVLLELQEGSRALQSVTDQFKDTWRHATATPTVVRVYKVLSAANIHKTYNAYKDQVEKERQFMTAEPPRPAGNEQRRWHG